MEILTKSSYSTSAIFGTFLLLLRSDPQTESKMQFTAFIGITVLAATTSATSVLFVCPADAIGECCLVIDPLTADDIQLCQSLSNPIAHH